MAETFLQESAEEQETDGRAEERSPAAGSEVFATAIAAIASRQDPGVARKTEIFLEKQARLLEIQAEHLEQEHGLRLNQLQGQTREGKLRRNGLRIRLLFQIISMVIAASIGLVILLMLHDAFISRRVIVEPFDAPAQLAERGLSGVVVAGEVFDELSRLQAATRSSAASKRDLSSPWTNEFKLVVPETGISIAEIMQFLTARLGNDLRIGGSLVESEGGALALSVRGDRVLPKTFNGAAGDLGKLTREAAQYVYAESDPVLWTAWLGNEGRWDDMVAFSKLAYSRATVADRPYLLNSWAVALSNTSDSQEVQRQSLGLLRAAVRLKPDYWVAYSNIMNTLGALGDEEGAWSTGNAMRKAAGGRPGRAPEANYQNWDALVWDLSSALASASDDADATDGLGTTSTSVGPQIAQAQALLHDPAAVEVTLETIRADENDLSIVPGVHYAKGLVALDVGDAAKAVAEMRAFGKDLSKPVVATTYLGAACWIARAEEAAGYSNEADALIIAGGRYVDCFRFKGDILDHRKDWTAAQKAYKEAVALAPDLPAAHYSWGVALLRHGDLANAEIHIKSAHQRGPHWADPLKVWGDILAHRGQLRQALAKYDEALKYAPAWRELKAARSAVADLPRGAVR